MTCAIVDSRIDKKAENALLSYADKILKMPPSPLFSTPVSAHPDMLMWCFDKQIITYRDYYTLARAEFCVLERLGYKITLCDEPMSKTYPFDVCLNCAVVGNNLIANAKYISEKIRDVSACRGLNIIHVNQGYAKCSAVCVSETAVITADPSIYASCIQNGLDALAICEGHVRLDGYNTGFIGGASGVTDTSVLFFGDLGSHPDAERITEFCKLHGKQAISLTNSPLYDYGTAFFVEEI